MTRGEDGETVHEGSIVVGYSIRAWEDGDEQFRYDWICDSGRDSDELFESIADAVRDVRQTLGG